MLISVEGIVLKCTPYEEDRKIIKIFTRSEGIIHALTSSYSSPLKSGVKSPSPLILAEFHLTRRGSTLYRIKDVSYMDTFIALREDYDRLQAALSMLQAVIITQMPEKAAPKLFHLLKVYLNALKRHTYPRTLEVSFLLKLMNHEGLFPETKEELFPSLSEEDWLLIELLCHTKNFDDLKNFVVNPALKREIIQLFHDSFMNLESFAEGGT